jgi:hypothetical protein
MLGTDRTWRTYDWRDALSIEQGFAEVPFWVEPRQVMCPIDGTVSVRSYYQRLSGGKSARYRWCPSCGHYSGQTVSVPPPPDFAEPVAVDIDTRLPDLLDGLEKAWSAGLLPQAFM